MGIRMIREDITRPVKNPDRSANINRLLLIESIKNIIEIISSSMVSE